MKELYRSKTWLVVENVFASSVSHCIIHLPTGGTLGILPEVWSEAKLNNRFQDVIGRFCNCADCRPAREAYVIKTCKSEHPLFTQIRLNAERAWKEAAND